MNYKYVFVFALITGLLLSACATKPVADLPAMAEAEVPMKDGEGAMDEGQDVEMAMDDSPASQSEESMPDTPAWFSAELMDVHTGATFKIEDLKGKVVLVETMAVWCSNCLRQQREVQALHTALGERDDFISIALDIDPNEDADKLKGFAENYGFDWLYAVAPAVVSSEIGDLYGQQFLNPPSTPILLIDPHGGVHILPFGIKSSVDLQGLVEGLFAAGM